MASVLTDLVSADQKSALLDALMDASLDGILVLQPVLDSTGAFESFRFGLVNRRARRILADQDDPAGQLVSRSFLNDPDGHAFDRCRGVWETGEPARFEIDRRSGPLGGVFRVTAVNAAGRVVVTLTEVTEMTEIAEALDHQRVELMYQNEVLDAQAAELARMAEDSEEARAEARNAERFVADLLEAIPVPMFFRTRDDGRFRMVNKRYAELHGRSRDEVVGNTIEELFEPALVEAIDARDAELYGGGEQRQAYETDITTPHFGERRVVVHKARMRDADDRVIGIAGVLVDVTDSHRLREELERLATTDPLTGLANRRVFLERAREETGLAARHQRSVSAVMIDIDHFKSINDRYGHEVGDRVLVRVAETIRDTLRKSGDLVARFGGEEFALLLPETSVTGALQLAERLRAALQAAVVDTDAGPVRFTASFGVEEFRAGIDHSIDTVLKRADDALYRAKNAGRNRVLLAA